MPTVVKIGDNVRHWRTVRTLTQVQLAEKAKISPPTLVRIEKNQADPHVSTIRKLAEALEVSPEQLILGGPAPKVEAPPSPEPPKEATEGRRELLSADEKLRKLPPDELRRIAAALSETWLPELPEGVSYRDALEFTSRKLAELELSFDEAREALPNANPVLARELEEWAAEVRRLKEKARRRRAAADTDTA